jgi:rubrerythrin
MEKTTIKSREELIYALCEAAEIEHGLTCVYLFTAFSMKNRLDEGIDEIQQDKIRNWKSVITRVARQEMEHLGLVCNMLNAIGGPQHFNRPNFPQSKAYYQTAVDLVLSKFSLGSMAAFMAFEKPDITPTDNYGLHLGQIVPTPIVIHNGHTVQELYEAILNGFIYLNGKIDLFIGDKAAQVNDDEINVGFGNKEFGITMVKVTDLDTAKAAIREIIEQGEGVILKGDAVDDDNKHLTKLYEKFDVQMNALLVPVIDENSWPGAVAEGAAISTKIAALLEESLPYILKYPQNQLIIEKALSVIIPSAADLKKIGHESYTPENAEKANELRAAINSAALNDAEGAILYEITVEKECHYLKFWDLYQDLKNELSKPGAFEPSRNVADNPMLRRHEDTAYAKDVHLVEYGYTRNVLELFNAGYETMVDMLIIFFANDGITPDERTLFMNTAFFPFMTMFIRPVGEILTMLPLAPDKETPVEALRAGGSFEFYINTALMPRTKKEWVYLGERLQELAALSKVLQHPPEDLREYLPESGYGFLQDQMKFLHTNLNRIWENFSLGMNLKK